MVAIEKQFFLLAAIFIALESTEFEVFLVGNCHSTVGALLVQLYINFKLPVESTDNVISKS